MYQCVFDCCCCCRRRRCIFQGTSDGEFSVLVPLPALRLDRPGRLVRAVGFSFGCAFFFASFFCFCLFICVRLIRSIDHKYGHRTARENPTVSGVISPDFPLIVTIADLRLARGGDVECAESNLIVRTPSFPTFYVRTHCSLPQMFYVRCLVSNKGLNTCTLP